jgi:hypothetical protein
MNYPGTFCCCLIFLFITACETQDQVATINKSTEIKSSSIETPAKVNAVPKQSIAVPKQSIAVPKQSIAVPKQSRELLNLSINDISLKKNHSGDRFIIGSIRSEKNSTLFNELSRKQPENGFNISGELLTDKSVDETNDFLDSVDGIHIELHGKFN